MSVKRFEIEKRQIAIVLLLDLLGVVFVVGLSFIIFPGGKKREDMLNYVDPMIGTVNGGHVFPGATLPYGMAKAVADVYSPGENAAGFVSDDAPVIGFSHLHDSGTSGSASLGNFPLFVHPSCPDADVANCAYNSAARLTRRVKGSVRASPGYFKIDLANGVRAEMTTSMKTALYRFSFSRNTRTPSTINEQRELNPLILLDLADLSNTQLGGGIDVRWNETRLTGYGIFRPSFGVGNYTAYFCADFQGAKLSSWGTFLDSKASMGIEELDIVGERLGGQAGSGGGWFRFENLEDNQIRARVGLSFISSGQACQNAETEIPNFDFAEVVKKARTAWRAKLSMVEVDTTGISNELRTTFWSGLYRAFISPQDYTGENPLWKSEKSEPYFDSFYCIWDSFRAQLPLLTVVDPRTLQRMIKTLLQVYRHLGFLPDCRMSFCKGHTQGMAYSAVKADAEITPKDWSVEGRGNHESWTSYNYIASDHVDTLGEGPNTRTVSRTLEYAYNDFCVAAIAEGLDHDDEAEKYLNRSGFWKNVWNPAAKDGIENAEGNGQLSEFIGFPQPRLMNGNFEYQSPRTCSPVEDMNSCFLSTAKSTYEGSPWLYSFYAPQDMAGLIEMVGGKEAFTARLDYFHRSQIAYMGNEQGFLTVFQFHYAGRPGKSSEWVHNYIPSQFNSSINGIPGNDDCAMGAFSSLAMMGFFPVAGQDVYRLTPPFFPVVRVHREKRQKPAIIRKRGDMDGIYIQSAKLNGKKYTKNWITHDFFTTGGVLELVVGTEESPDWGTRDEDVPPSRRVGPR